MRFPYLLCLLTAQVLHAQTPQVQIPQLQNSQVQTSPEQTSYADPAHAQPAPEDAVITINGFCADPAPPQPTPCQTIITRAQFDQLTQALDPGMPTELRLKVAEAYARMLRMAAIAEQRGLDKTPAFAEELRYARLQLLSQDLTRTLHQDAENIPDAQVETYYRDNQASFEQATLARIFIPRAAHGPNPSEDKMLQLAADLRARAAHGADPDGGHFIYKMISKETLSLQQAQPEIHKQLSDQRYREATRSFSTDVTFNDTYFATYATPHRHQRDRRDLLQLRGQGTSR